MVLKQGKKLRSSFLTPGCLFYDGGFTYRIIRKNIKLLLFTLISLMSVGLLSSSAQASAFSMQCCENERISRIVVRTGHNEQFQFLLGKIKTARQGQFSINNRDKNNPHIKKIRVVSTIEYYLSD